MAGSKCASYHTHTFYRKEVKTCGKFGKRVFSSRVGLRDPEPNDFCITCGKTRAELRLTPNPKRFKKPKKEKRE